ncbi:MAG: LytTR family transcriptional regulator [SAR324 cluster bacterium]|nr:LytTR family transcriptional regulator [SAR324 cluster bacterium]
MTNKVPIDDARILRKIIEGIDMIFNVDTANHGPLSEAEEKAKVDSGLMMRQMMALNKIELLIDRILYIYAESPYCRIFFESQNDFEMDLRLPIHALVENFRPEELLRIHRSYVINPKKVLCVDKKNPRDYEVWLKNGPKNTAQIPLGRSYMPDVQKRYPKWFTS